MVRPGTIAVLKEAVEALVRMLSPFAPHMAEELWEQLGHRRRARPRRAGRSTTRTVAKAEQIVVPVQVNGKLRARLTVPADIIEERTCRRWRSPIRTCPASRGARQIKKVMVARGRLVSIVVS